MRSTTVARMPVVYRTDAPRGLTIAVIDGSVTHEEFHELARRQMDDAAWHANRRLLTDARTAVTRHVSEEELHAFADLYAEMRRGDRPSRAAIVAHNDFDLAGRYGALRSSRRATMIAFNDVVTACAWLGVDIAAVRTTIAELRSELRGEPSWRGSRS